MSRKTLIRIHLLIACFFAPALILTALSGGLYLLGFKGDVHTEIVYTGNASEFNYTAENKEQEFRRVFNKLGMDVEFEYIKGSGQSFFTRPTSKVHYLFEIDDDQFIIKKRDPNILLSIVELHKGHGPVWFRHYQKLMALGLLFILVSGLWMGFSAPGLKKMAWFASGVGTVIYLLLIV